MCTVILLLRERRAVGSHEPRVNCSRRCEQDGRMSQDEQDTRKGRGGNGFGVSVACRGLAGPEEETRWEVGDGDGDGRWARERRVVTTSDEDEGDLEGDSKGAGVRGGVRGYVHAGTDYSDGAWLRADDGDGMGWMGGEGSTAGFGDAAGCDER